MYFFHLHCARGARCHVGVCVRAVISAGGSGQLIHNHATRKKKKHHYHTHNLCLARDKNTWRVHTHINARNFYRHSRAHKIRPLLAQIAGAVYHKFARARAFTTTATTTRTTRIIITCSAPRWRARTPFLVRIRCPSVGRSRAHVCALARGESAKLRETGRL